MGVLVTGGAGYIGSHMVLQQLDADEDVIVLDNLSTGFCWAVPDGAKFVEGDVGDHNLVRRILLRNTVDAIIHWPVRSWGPTRSPIHSTTISTTRANRDLCLPARPRRRSRISSSPRPLRSMGCPTRIPSRKMRSFGPSRRT